MKFIFADSMDVVDPHFDFLREQNGKGRQKYWDDQYPHEILGYAPYDGMLVSRAIVGDAGRGGKYSESESMRFRRVGARSFLRLNNEKFSGQMLFGDCGAFSYAKETVPPFKAPDTVEFYGDGCFTHGCSIDHIIFDFDVNAKGLSSGTDDSRERFEITLELASEFLEESKILGEEFTPVGVVQGWSPDSMATATQRLIDMGYQYIAIGGLVPLAVDEIHQAVDAVEAVAKTKNGIKIHLLGFGKADNLHEFKRYSRIASFDTTSPLLRAFKDHTKNYYLPSSSDSIEYFSAIRIPQAIDNNRLKSHAKSGRFSQEHLLKLEQRALNLLRAFDTNAASIEETLDALIEYAEPLVWTANMNDETLKRKLHSLRIKYKKTLDHKPWKLCSCNICLTAGVETLIFRGSNRNKRRGIHNLAVFYDHVRRTLN